MVKIVQKQMGSVSPTFFPMTMATLLLVPIVRREVKAADSPGFLGAMSRLFPASNPALLMLGLPVSTAVMACFLLGAAL